MHLPLTELNRSQVPRQTGSHTAYATYVDRLYSTIGTLICATWDLQNVFSPFNLKSLPLPLYPLCSCIMAPNMLCKDAIRALQCQQHALPLKQRLKQGTSQELLMPLSTVLYCLKTGSTGWQG
jgi:hypothetical protein